MFCASFFFLEKADSIKEELWITDICKSTYKVRVLTLTKAVLLGPETAVADHVSVLFCESAVLASVLSRLVPELDKMNG